MNRLCTHTHVRIYLQPGVGRSGPRKNWPRVCVCVDSVATERIDRHNRTDLLVARRIFLQMRPHMLSFMATTDCI